MDVTNVLNHPVFDNPNTDINSTLFGRISKASDRRQFTVGARLNFQVNRTSPMLPQEAEWV